MCAWKSVLLNQSNTFALLPIRTWAMRPSNEAQRVGGVSICGSRRHRRAHAQQRSSSSSKTPQTRLISSALNTTTPAEKPPAQRKHGGGWGGGGFICDKYARTRTKSPKVNRGCNCPAPAPLPCPRRRRRPRRAPPAHREAHGARQLRRHERVGARGGAAQGADERRDQLGGLEAAGGGGAESKTSAWVGGDSRWVDGWLPRARPGGEFCGVISEGTTRQKCCRAGGAGDK